MYQRLTKLILQRYYTTKEAAREKVDVLYSYDKLTTTEYNTLVTLIDEVYTDEDANAEE